MPRSKSLLIRGHLGIGKSALVKQAASIMENMLGKPVALVDIRLSQQDVGDLRGIPYMVGGNTFFAPPMWYPISPEYLKKQEEFLSSSGHKYIPWQTHEHGIIFLDELNRATREVLQCSFELTLDHRLGGVPIPPGWLVVAAVNHDPRVYQVHNLDPAHINRFLVVDFRPEVDEWVRYAQVRVQGNQMHPAVLDYIKANPSKLDPLESDLASASKSGDQLATRRSWTTLAEVLQEIPNLDPKDDFTALLVQSCIGNMHLASFLSYLVNQRKTIPPESVVYHYNGAVAGKVLNLLDDGHAHEVTAINRAVLELLHKLPVELDRTVASNIIQYLMDLPDELASDFYATWKKVHTDQASYCYALPALDDEGHVVKDPRGKVVYPLKKRMFQVFSNPDGKR